MLRRLQENATALIATSVIVQGELIFMAERSEQKAVNLARVQTFLHGIRIYPVESATAVLYGELKATLLQHFGPKEKSKRRRITLAHLGFDDNDLWIAAIALQHALAVVSSDNGFQRMREAQDFSLESWWSPSASSSTP